MQFFSASLLAIFGLLTFAPSAQASDQYGPIRLAFTGPQASETGPFNPFRDVRLEVVFTQGTIEYRVPGYFAADGQSAFTSAEAGNQWHVVFAPAQSGTWNYRAAFRRGKDLALSLDPAAGESIPGDGQTGTVEFAGFAKDDPRSRGRLEYVGERYLRWSTSGDYFLKNGTDSPENFLAYAEFDGTRPSHRYRPHRGDYRQEAGWGKSRDQGKALFGAINYLADSGVNSIYMLTMNVAGDGKDVWPWSAENRRDRFDVSKLAQWEMAFDHIARRGMQLHLILTETENETLFEHLDGSDFADTRKLYFRELVARFAHHPAIVWNLGEENGPGGNEKQPKPGVGRSTTHLQRVSFANYLRHLDPYNHPIVVHTYPGQFDAIYQPLLGEAALEGVSLQIGGPIERTHSETLKWVARSAKAQRPWAVCLDEIGPANEGVPPDGAGEERRKQILRHVVWGNLLAGGSGCEWYFGYKHPHNDLNLEDFRSRDIWWRETSTAVELFRKTVPFFKLQPADELVVSKNAWCLAKPGEFYALFAAGQKEVAVRVEAGDYEVRWFNTKNGFGGLVQEQSLAAAGEAKVKLPADPGGGLLVTLRRAD